MKQSVWQNGQIYIMYVYHCIVFLGNMSMISVIKSNMGLQGDAMYCFVDTYIALKNIGWKHETF